MQRRGIQVIVLILLIIVISAVFVTMIRGFLMVLLLAGIFAALTRPVHRRLTRWLGGRAGLASLMLLLLLCLVVLLPLFGLAGIITAQAVKVGQSITPWVQRQIAEPGAFSYYLQNLPFYEDIIPYHEVILRKAGELASRVSVLLVNALSAGAIGTVNFIFNSVIFLYISFFILVDGKKLLNRILYYLPLDTENKERLLNRFTSVTRATLKGTAVIGVLQGCLAGLAFKVVGIDAAVFWGTIMTVLSIIPAVGSALVWVPAAIILAIGGSYLKAVGLVLFCGGVVGSLDNVLRPRLVGKDTQMHDLMIFFGTLGGLTLFGMIGFIIGPIIAALFVTVWEIYGEVFRGWLQEPDEVKVSSVEASAEPLSGGRGR